MKKVIQLHQEGFYKSKANELLQKAIEMIVNEKYEEAKELLKESSNFDANNEEAIYLTGYIYFLLEEYELSLEYMKKVVELNGRNLEYKYIYGLVLLRNREYSRSENVFKEILTKDPNHTKVKYYLGKMYFETKEYIKSIMIYKEIEDVFEEPYNVYFEIASCYAMILEYEESIKYLNKTMELKKNFPYAYDLLSNIHIKEGNDTKAIQVQYEKMKNCPHTYHETIQKIELLQKMKHI